MTEELRVAIGIFELYATADVTVSEKTHLKILCSGHAAVARGWRFIATGEGVENEIIADLEKATCDLMAGEQQPKGSHLGPVPHPGDEMVIRRYYEREPQSLTLWQFVKAAYKTGELDPQQRSTIEVHFNRLSRRIARE